MSGAMDKGKMEGGAWAKARWTGHRIDAPSLGLVKLGRDKAPLIAES